MEENEICKRIIILINENNVDAKLASLEEILYLLAAKKYFIIEQLLQENIVSNLIKFLNHSNFEIQEKSLEILFDLSNNEELNQTQNLIDSGILKSMTKLLESSDLKIAQKSAEFLSKFTIDSNEYIQAICDAGLISPLIDLLYKDSPKAQKVNDC
uniref:HEAT repeat domain-containing protein n=1 Tax=Panagrolaimus sp. ES5 TaxID=591445 RepID=A0AC34GTS4_9BILA